MSAQLFAGFVVNQNRPVSQAHLFNVRKVGEGILLPAAGVGINEVNSAALRNEFAGACRAGPSLWCRKKTGGNKKC